MTHPIDRAIGISKLTDGEPEPDALVDAARRQRASAVIAPQGNLALMNTQWITGDVGVSQPIWGVPGLWSPLPIGSCGLLLRAPASDAILVDDELVHGDVVVSGMDAVSPSRIRFSDTVTGTVIANEEGDHALRVWDADSEAIRDFRAIEAFPYDQAWVVEAKFTPDAGTSDVSIAYLKEEGKTRANTVPGEISFTLGAEEHRLVVYQDGPSWLLVFADATTGDTSYSVGRFLRVAPGYKGAVSLDFNLAYLPPCAFSYNFSCPIPPKQNRLGIAVTAGERNVLTRNSDLLH
ncbi:DUF1684 domain-containing protein [Cryobacterium algoritolerans]|uniref:DUF1684 domain-containing protein n=1 Tax=Cryobacterium algoritolerans TaxID=1259184 RepID=A0A4R8WVE7_9MICO|nr:DUF1684 domain-containing protein [Cryobacterium algoritolerans]TFC18932.1 DUF1684 domain-containing protein [Cryobacterium algoritolerans]